MSDPDEIICLDIETTGISTATAEILQLSIINFDGKVLFNKYIKPDRARFWPEAERVNHIGPAMVANKHHLSYYRDELKAIFAKAKVIVTYNGNCFDLPIVARYGFPEVQQIKSYDVMAKFKTICGGRRKLCVCAKYYGYCGGGDFHDSLEDVRATLFCYKKMVSSNAVAAKSRPVMNRNVVNRSSSTPNKSETTKGWVIIALVILLVVLEVPFWWAVVIVLIVGAMMGREKRN